MKRITTTLLLALLVCTLSYGGEYIITPTPQKTNFKNGIKRPESIKVFSENKSFVEYLDKANIDSKNGKSMNVFIGNKDEKRLSKFTKFVPNKKEAYYIKIEKNNIYVVGNDDRGTYYGVRTLEQLLNYEELPLGEITDYPDVESRGVVEGFYGTPWSHEKRLRQLDFYGKFKLNTYIYGPKDDPYHSSPNWRKDYPEQEAKQIKELVDRAKKNYVDFVWAIHPGKDIKWNNEDRDNLIHKFESMYKLGVRTFAVFFDDIFGEGTNPIMQSNLLNHIQKEFIEKKGDVNQLIMCPTEYNKSWSKPEKKYLEILGENLHPSINIMWTGNYVIADIDKKTMEWINQRIKRKGYIWWNFPVSDYVRDHMLLGKVYGNTKDIKNDLSGFVSNPMEYPEASKIAIYGVADYTWNIEKYDSEKAWINAMKEVMPNNYKALHIFAKHNSDLGENGHRYRRNESEEFMPIAKRFLNNLSTNNDSEAYTLVLKEFEEISSATEDLLKEKHDTLFIEEIKPWLIQYRALGKLGKGTMELYSYIQKRDYKNFLEKYFELENIKKEMYKIDQTYNQNPYQPGVKVATLVIEPLINKTLRYSIDEYNKQTNGHFKHLDTFNPNKIYTNVVSLSNQPLIQKGKLIRISPKLEYSNITQNEYLGIEFEKPKNISEIYVDLANKEALEKGEIQLSEDGKVWKSVTLTEEKKGTYRFNVNMKNIKYVRYISVKDGVEVKVTKFEVKEQ